MQRVMIGIALALLCSTGLGFAQQPTAGPPQPILLVNGQPVGRPEAPPPQGGDPLAGNFFPPELIMQNQQALGLTEEQKGAMIAEIQRTQGVATSIQWRLQQQMERLGILVREPKVEEAAVLAQLDSLLAAEREMKRAQITLLVRLKNRLTPDQQATLRQRMSAAR